jgi:hypothetical protein
MHCLRQAVIAAGLVTAAAAQPVKTEPILSGYLYDANARALRAILGIPGAASLSSAIVDGLDAAWPSPDRDHAVGIRGEHTLVFTGLKSLQPSEAAEIQLISRPARVCWSARGRAAVLYSPAERVIQIVRVDGGRITPESPVSVSSVGTDITALSVTDAGRVTLAAGGAVYVMTESGPAQQWGLTDATALASCDERLYAAAGGAIVELGPGGEISHRFASDFGASGIACAGERVFTVHPLTPEIVVYRNDGTLDLRIPLDRQPSTLQPVQSDSVILLNGVEAERLPPLVLSVSGSPGVFFIPAGDAGAL